MATRTATYGTSYGVFNTNGGGGGGGVVECRCSDRFSRKIK